MTEGAPPRLSVTGLSKSFGGAHALDGVDLEVAPGEIHGLLGKNGSGKSTLIKILSGFHAPDAGELRIDGRQAPLPLPIGRSEAYGLAFVHQNLGLLPEATVLENLIAGDHERLNPWHIGWRHEAARAEELFEGHHLELDPFAIVADLSPVERAQLAIVRAADRIREHGEHGGPGLLILDEPTPFLPMEDVRQLFAMMRRLKATGVSIVFVSHDIDEVVEITDRVTVLRDGRIVGSFEPRSAGRGRIVEAIVGRAVASERLVADLPSSSVAARAAVRGLSGAIVRGVSFEVRPGEILGLTGLIGAGHDEVPYLLAGARRPGAGELTIDGRSHVLPQMTPAAAVRAGLVLIPADRPRAGVAPDLSLTDNLALPVLGQVSRPALLDHRRLARHASELMRDFGVKADSPEQAASDLSGGNQQKLVLAKWLQTNPRLVLLDEPTQGIDIGARREVFDRLVALCAAGGAVVCATSEYEQLETIAHRVLVFERGRVKAELSGAGVTKSAIAAACYGEAPSLAQA